MEINELDLIEIKYVVRESDNNNAAHLGSVDNWQSLFPDVTQVEGSAGSNNSSGLRREHVVYREVSGSSNNHLREDTVTTSIDYDPMVTFTSPCSSSLTSWEDLYQEKDQSGNKSERYCDPLEENQSKFEDDKIVAVTIPSKSENDKFAIAMDSPTKQMMERDLDYDPHRIPASVFDRSDSMAPAEWSAASNESLFSLHCGTSFGRDQAALIGAESHKLKAEDLPKLDELTSNPPSASDEAGDCASEAVAGEKGVEESESVKDKTKEDGEKPHSSEEESAKPPSAVMGSSVSCRSDASDGSTFSFAFPILAPGRVQSSSTKGGGSTSPNTIHLRDPHSEPENNMGTPQPPATAGKTSYFSCFSSCCSFPSFCSCSRSSCCRPRCSCCWPFKS